jgi:protein-tyrosine phosphatase
VSTHHLSLFAEGGHHTDVEADLDTPAGVDRDGDGDGGGRGGAGSGRGWSGVRADIERALAVGPAAAAAAESADLVLPWQARQERLGAQRSLDFYLGYLRDRPDSIVAALRVLAHDDGTALVHCAAGKDRTGVVVAFALETAGVERQAIVDDYVQTGERLEPLLARLRASTTYAEDLDSRPADSHRPHAATMEGFLAVMDDDHGGPLGWLTRHGWTDADTAALRARLTRD